VALLDDTLAAVECTVTARLPHGDHSILVGSVDGGSARDLQPLLYYRGGYASLSR
jgi:flavin reductase (DIM6/NTAB) family NADH-FMN oxidoreductase RutF